MQSPEICLISAKGQTVKLHNPVKKIIIILPHRNQSVKIPLIKTQKLHLIRIKSLVCGPNC